MPAGLQCWNAAGVKTLDTVDTLSRVLGILRVDGPGSLAVPAFLTGRPFIMVFNESGATLTPAATQKQIVAGIQSDGITLTWQRFDGSTAADWATIIYGLR